MRTNSSSNGSTCRVAVLVAGAALALAQPSVRAADQPGPAGVDFFERKVRPVLVQHCYACHSAEAQQKKKLKGGLLLDSRAGLLKGGETGPAIVPGDLKKSLLIEAVHHDGLEMPPKNKLSAAVIADLEAWVKMGAPDPRDSNAATARAIDWDSARQFWSFQPVRLPPVPTVHDSRWPKGTIDRFILARLEAEQLRSVGPADKRTLIRRATFDLIGLPPTPEEVEAFLKDDSPEAFGRVVDRLLASRHYGERWGRYWLDVARYAEDQAHTFGVKPYTNAYRYRDWVIDAFNTDMSYDRFLKLQIAADLMADSETRDRAALGFFGLGAQYYMRSDAKTLLEETDDRVDTVGRGMLGLTVSCARCHDHKFDPIPTQDYYSLAGVFYSCQLADVPLAPREQVERYQDSQKRIQAADREVKEYLRIEKARLAEAHVGDIAAYLVAVWKVQARRQTIPGYATASQAREDHLNAAVLDRCLRYLTPGNKATPNVAALEAWRRLPRAKGKSPEAGPDVHQAAEAFQKHVQTLLARRDARPVKKGLDKPELDLLAGLFGERGVFEVAESQLPADKKARLETLRAEWQRLTKTAPPAPPLAHGLVETKPIDLQIYVRGNPAQKGELAPRRFLRILAGDQPPRFTHGSGRLELAEAIASKDNPLTARVLVNRLWQHHFGRGLVGTPSNFGQLGERPSHPELLDYLATRFIASGWSIKQLHREIMLSATYQLSADRSAELQQTDPDNRLLGRMNRRRLDVEAWRDALLAVAGQLDRTAGGPTVDLNAAGNHRRTVYARISRHDLNGLLRLFDFPEANLTSDKRTETTVPQQQLFVLNGPFFIAQAQALAARAQTEDREETTRIQRVYLLAFGRPASAAELAIGQRYLHGTDAPEEAGKNRLTRWERYAQVLLGSNEFMYVD